MHLNFITVIALVLVHTITATVYSENAKSLKIRKRGLRPRDSLLPDIVLPAITTQQQPQQPQQQPARVAYPQNYVYPPAAYYPPANTAAYSPPVVQAVAPVVQSVSPPPVAAPAAPATLAQPIQVFAPPKKSEDDEEEEDEDEPDEEDFDADDLVTRR
jgi:hypothetical protein